LNDIEIIGRGGKKLNPIPATCTGIAAAGRGTADEVERAVVRKN